jgi:predicted enzyme related to lactoylglutathione lyase
MTQNNEPHTQSGEANVDPSLARNGGLSYLEIPALDVRRSAAFYANVLGWKVVDTESNAPRFSDPSGHLIGRWISGRVISREPGLLPYFYVDRVVEAVSRAAATGGEMIKPPHAEGNLLVATIRDPAGNVIGLWQQA